MRNYTLFRPLLLAYLSCACNLPPASGQEDKSAKIFVQGSGEIKQNPKNKDLTNH